MLKLIEPKDHYNYRSRINLFLGLLEFYQNTTLHLEEQSQCSFILDEEEDGHISGGAILYKKSISDLDKNIEKLVTAFPLNTDYVWASTLVFCHPSQVMQVYFQEFYENLLEAFREFAYQEDINFLCLTLNPLEYLRTKNKGCWSYIMEVKPQESIDGLFHGILPLSEHNYKVQFSPQDDARHNYRGFQIAA